MIARHGKVVLPSGARAKPEITSGPVVTVCKSRPLGNSQICSSPEPAPRPARAFGYVINPLPSGRKTSASPPGAPPSSGFRKRSVPRRPRAPAGKGSSLKIGSRKNCRKRRTLPFLHRSRSSVVLASRVRRARRHPAAYLVKSVFASVSADKLQSFARPVRRIIEREGQLARPTGPRVSQSACLFPEPV